MKVCDGVHIYGERRESDRRYEASSANLAVWVRGVCGFVSQLKLSTCLTGVFCQAA